ncbi:MAG: DUF4440 domain-containing protein [Chloroflexi bacterium]|nr:MAG: DUF4440 domain-containing protein [Chloroflexota bacterium]
MANLRSLVERHYENFATANIAAEDEIFGPNVVTVDPGAGTVEGLDAFKAYEEGFRRAFPDGRLNLNSAIEGGNSVTVEGTFTGTNTGPLASPAGEIPATGRKLELPFADFFEVESGKITRHRIYYDRMTFMHQLGLIPQ